MKMFILGLMVSSMVMAQSQDSKPEIISDKELSSKFVSVIQGAKLEDQLVETGEFKTCADQAKFDPKKLRKDQTLDPTAAKSLADCFSKQIGTRKPEEIQKLSDSLNLQGYQLVRGKTVRDITSYLTNSVYKRMTGIDLDSKDMAAKIESMKFKNEKHVDQRDFAELYRIQLGKSALYEISRFCFVNLRNTTNPGSTDFIDHWKSTSTSSANPSVFLSQFIVKDKQKGSVTLNTGLTDSALPIFGSMTETDKDKIYTNIKDSLAGPNATNFNPDSFKEFFENCMLVIAPMCDAYKKATDQKTAIGGNACITQARLQDIRRGMANTKKVLDQFDHDLTNAKGAATIRLNEESSLKKYNSGDATDGFNAISTITSNEILEGSKADQDNTLAKDCNQGKSSGEDCKGFLVEDDSFKQALHDTDVNLTLKTELEVKNLEALYSDKTNLEKYLSDRGYFDLLKVYQGPPTPSMEVFIVAVRSMFEARKQAALAALHKTMGDRQVDKTLAAGETQSPTIENAIKNSAEATAEERGRLAQVVLFTNIVTSQLELKRDDGSGNVVSLGKNQYALTKEKGGLDSTFFSTSGSGSGGSSTSTGSSSTEVAATSNNFLQDISFLDQVIGKDVPAKP